MRRKHTHKKMTTSSLCPYLDAHFTDSVDALLNTLDAVSRRDKLQQLVYHLQIMPSLAERFSPVQLFEMGDSNFATLLDPSMRLSGHERYHELTNMKFDTGDVSTIRCKKCGHGGVEWVTKQTRSADEASTTFCQCTNKKCSAKWKM